MDRRDACVRQIGGHAAGHDAIAHQPVAETRIGGAQHALAQHAAMGVHERERRVVADRADVAHMVREPFELGHERAQPLCARRDIAAECRLRRPRKGDRIGDRAVAGDPPGELGGAVETGACYQRLDALVGVSETLLEPHDRLAAGGEAEMPWLDDAGVDRTDRDLVQALALGREEDVGRAVARRLRCAAQLRRYRPAAMVEPRARIGRTFGLEAEEVADRAFEADRRWMQRADRRKPPVRTFEAQHGEFAGGFVVKRHLHGAPIAP